MVQVLGKWAQHIPASDAEDVAQWGSQLIFWIANDGEASHNARWLDAGTEKLLRAIMTCTQTSRYAKTCAGNALRQLGCEVSMANINE